MLGAEFAVAAGADMGDMGKLAHEGHDPSVGGYKIYAVRLLPHLGVDDRDK